MEPRRDDRRRPSGPNQEPLPKTRSRWPIPGRSRDPYLNPSLERYSDLQTAERKPRRIPRWLMVLGSLFLLGVLIFGWFFGNIYWQSRHDEARKVDAIVVMGAAQWNGKVSPVLRERLTHALNLYQDGLAPKIIVTGGAQGDDIYTEAEVAQAWMEQRGVPADAILVDKTSLNTVQQMQNVGALARDNDIQTILIVSDGFHLYRSERLAEANGLTAYSSAASDLWIARGSSKEFAYMLRETVAVIVQIPDWLF